MQKIRDTTLILESWQRQRLQLAGLLFKQILPKITTVSLSSLLLAFMLRISRRKTLLSGLLKDGLYPIPRGFSPPSSHGGSQCFASISHSISTWHSQVGHPSASVLKSFAPSLSLPTKSLNDFFFMHCPFGKSKKLPFNLVNEPPPHSLHTIYFGVWGSFPHKLWMVIIIMLYLSMVLLDLLGSCPYFRNWCWYYLRSFSSIGWKFIWQKDLVFSKWWRRWDC